MSAAPAKIASATINPAEILSLRSVVILSDGMINENDDAASMTPALNPIRVS